MIYDIINMNDMLIYRTLTTELIAMAKSYPVVTVLGPRQSGKTTLVKATFPQKAYVSLENLDERSFALSDPRGFLARFPKGAIFDEIQRSPELLSYIQGVVDEQEIKGQYILTGSHQFSLHNAISQSLAGRTAVLKLLPLSVKELCDAGIHLPLNELMCHGMYPRIYKDKLDPFKVYRDYTQTYLERDIRHIINIKDLTLFHHFLKLCAGRVGQLFNSSAISNELGVSTNTIREWLSILEASFVIMRLPPFYENLGKRLIKSHKIYFTDVGLACYLLDISTPEQLARDPLRGNLFENLVITDFIKNLLNIGHEPSCYFYRDSNQNEVDLIFKQANLFIPIEIKSSQTFNPSFLKGLDYFNQVQKKTPRGYLIYAGTIQQQVQNYQVINYLNIDKIIRNEKVL